MTDRPFPVEPIELKLLECLVYESLPAVRCVTCRAVSFLPAPERCHLCDQRAFVREAP